MVAQLVRHERLETTLPKAKELRRVADRAVTWGKTGDIPARRAAAAFLPRAGNDGTLAKLFGPLAARYAEREGGYTRVLASRVRGGDGAGGGGARARHIDRCFPADDPGLPPPAPPAPTASAGAVAAARQTPTISFTGSAPIPSPWRGCPRDISQGRR